MNKKPTINESLPKIKLSEREHDKTVYGVVAGIEGEEEVFTF